LDSSQEESVKERYLKTPLFAQLPISSAGHSKPVLGLILDVNGVVEISQETVIASEAKQSHSMLINELKIASSSFGLLAMTLEGFFNTSLWECVTGKSFITLIEFVRRIYGYR
jgi:hypothetical protein